MRREQRAQPRKSVNFRVLTASGEDQGEGTLIDISLSGALIESRTVRPRLGAPVKIVISTDRGSASVEIVGTVARHAQDGFAIEFAKTTRLIRRLVERGKVGL